MNSNNINKKMLQHSQDNTNFFARKLKEIEKGCRKQINKSSMIPIICDDYDGLCESCKAQKQILLKCMNEVRKAIDDVHKIKKINEDGYDYCHTCDVLEELKSNLGISEEDEE